MLVSLFARAPVFVSSFRVVLLLFYLCVFLLLLFFLCFVDCRLLSLSFCFSAGGFLSGVSELQAWVQLIEAGHYAHLENATAPRLSQAVLVVRSSV